MLVFFLRTVDHKNKNQTVYIISVVLCPHNTERQRQRQRQGQRERERGRGGLSLSLSRYIAYTPHFCVVFLLCALSPFTEQHTQHGSLHSIIYATLLFCHTQSYMYMYTPQARERERGSRGEMGNNNNGDTRRFFTTRCCIIMFRRPHKNAMESPTHVLTTLLGYDIYDDDDDDAHKTRQPHRKEGLPCVVVAVCMCADQHYTISSGITCLPGLFLRFFVCCFVLGAPSTCIYPSTIFFSGRSFVVPHTTPYDATHEIILFSHTAHNNNTMPVRV